MNEKPVKPHKFQETNISPLGAVSIFLLGICVGVCLMYAYASTVYDNVSWQAKRDQPVDVNK